MPIDESLKFLPVNIAVLTVSDTRDMASDRSGQTLQERIEAARHHCVAREIVKDDPDAIEAVLRRWIADPAVDCVITTGGTGITGRDVTPEAFKRVLEKEIEGFGELFRWISFQKIGTSTIQSRAMGGVAGGSLFALGKYLMAIYLSTAAVVSAYGAAGSLVVLLMWIYFSSAVLLLSASVARALSDEAALGKAGPAPA